MKKKINAFFLSGLFVLLSANLSLLKAENVSFNKAWQQHFESANGYYKNKQYLDALKIYEDILKQFFSSSKKKNHLPQPLASVYYNLANTHLKLYLQTKNEVHTKASNQTQKNLLEKSAYNSHLAKSIFYYQKALKVAPTFEDAKNNLDFTRSLVSNVWVVLPLSSKPKPSLFKRPFQKSKRNSIVFICLMSLLCLASGVCCFYFLHSKKRYFLFGAIFCGVLYIVFASGFFLTKHFQKKISAVIASKHTSLRSAPTNESEEIVLLHEGNKINILKVEEEWAFVILAGEEKGWVLTNDFLKLDESSAYHTF